MGFFSGISNWIGNNAQSVVHDVVHFSNQVTSNPISQILLPIAGVALGIPPQVTTAGLNVINGLEGEYLNPQQSQPQIDSNIDSFSDPYTATAQTPDGQPLYKDSTDGKFHYVNNHSMTYPATTSVTSPSIEPFQSASKTTFQKIVDNAKSYWYIYVGVSLVIITGLVYYFKHKHPKTSRKW